MAKESWAHREAVVNGVRLHWVEQGTGPLVLLLHGFPEFWYGWRHQIPALAAAGFRVAAPDLRGYNLSDKPRGLAAYGVEPLVADAAGLIRHLGAERACVAGHDWGGVVAWWLAMLHPELVERLVIANAPHPRALAREMRKPRQLLRFWYAAFFQLPALPEALLRARDFAALERVLRHDPRRPGAFTDEDIRRYKESWRQPGALPAMLAYYRAVRRTRRPRTRPVAAPTLLLWGERDRALRVQLTEGLEPWVPDLRVERIPDASHWVLADAPGRVSERMADFLRGA
ncbi:MAG TPA: alpha/beta hydrolase [Longimicrobiaceae bacterium]|nr:alpha/beta hydrolase [Longimicrobiaceae bacterium]